jgi:hypothetical protein
VLKQSIHLFNPPSGHSNFQEKTMGMTSSPTADKQTTDQTSGMAGDSTTTLAGMKAVSADMRAFQLETTKIEAIDKKDSIAAKVAGKSIDGLTA